MVLKEKPIEIEEIFKGKVFDVTLEKAEIENGQTAMRELVHHNGGVCVVPVDEDGNVYMVKQFRYPFKEVLLEVPAGKLEKGESHKECGIRELREEIGATAESVEYLGFIYPTVAYDTEIIHMYLAKGLSFGEQDLDDDEFVDIVKMPLSEAFKLVMDNKIPDAKTQAAILKTYVLLNK
ncbi:MAG: NUDIX hydrolase [Ruminococcus sp.]|nr:NUDIX hydrolase [Ruminococcus sp.]